MFCDATIALPNIQAGKVVALGTSAAKPTQLVAERSADRRHGTGVRLAGMAGNRCACGHPEGA